MTRRLTGTVHVRTDDGRSGVFGPGDDVPAWAAALITNPKAWSDNSDATPPTPEPPPAPEPESDGGNPPPATPERPPTAGPGSGRDAWAQYATTLGITFTDDDKRDDIVALVDAQQ